MPKSRYFSKRKGSLFGEELESYEPPKCITIEEAENGFTIRVGCDTYVEKELSKVITMVKECFGMKEEDA